MQFIYNSVIESFNKHWGINSKDSASASSSSAALAVPGDVAPNTGAGCILAHCMGLGKTLSVISFVHTILSYSDQFKLRTCLILCPANVVLNWEQEWRQWFADDDRDQVRLRVR